MKYFLFLSLFLFASDPYREIVDGLSSKSFREREQASRKLANMQNVDFEYLISKLEHAEAISRIEKILKNKAMESSLDSLVYLKRYPSLLVKLKKSKPDTAIEIVSNIINAGGFEPVDFVGDMNIYKQIKSKEDSDIADIRFLAALDRIYALHAIAHKKTLIGEVLMIPGLNWLSVTVDDFDSFSIQKNISYLKLYVKNPTFEGFKNLISTISDKTTIDIFLDTWSEDTNLIAAIFENPRRFRLRSTKIIGCNLRYGVAENKILYNGLKCIEGEPVSSDGLTFKTLRQLTKSIFFGDDILLNGKKVLFTNRKVIDFYDMTLL